MDTSRESLEQRYSKRDARVMTTAVESPMRNDKRPWYFKRDAKDIMDLLNLVIMKAIWEWLLQGIGLRGHKGNKL